MHAIPLDKTISELIEKVEEWERIDSPWLFEEAKPVPPQPIFGKGGKPTGKFKASGQEALKQMEIQMGRAATPVGSNPRGAKLPERDDRNEALRRTQQAAVAAILKPLNATAQEMERKWGVGRLQSLVSEEWSLKFHTAADKLSKAVEATDMVAIRERAEIMRRGWIKLDELASAAGALPWSSPDVWEVRGNGGQVYAIARTDFDQWSADQKDGVVMYTLDEIAVILEAWDAQLKASELKKAFPDSRLTKATMVPPIEDDDIPF